MFPKSPWKPQMWQLYVKFTWPSRIRASWYNYENNKKDALYRLIYYFKSALHVSDDVFAHHQQHLTLFTVSGSVHPSCCRLVSHSALRVSEDVFAHHQEHLTVFTVSGSVHPRCCRLVSWMSWNWVSTHPWHQPAATWVNTTRYCKYSQVLLMMDKNVGRNM
jgi:hypothetical protein